MLTNPNPTPHTDQSQSEPYKLKPKPNKHATTSYRSKLIIPKPTIVSPPHPNWNCKPKPNKHYSYPQRRRRGPYPWQNQTHPTKSPTKTKPIHLFSSQWQIGGGSPNWEGGRSFWCKSIFVFSLFLWFSLYLFLILRVASMPILRLWFLGWKRRKKEAESGFCSWLFQSRNLSFTNSISTWILKSTLALSAYGTQVSITWVAMINSSLSNSRCQFPK